METKIIFIVIAIVIIIIIFTQRGQQALRRLTGLDPSYIPPVAPPLGGNTFGGGSSGGHGAGGSW
jgi:hypothetical protein